MRRFYVVALAGGSGSGKSYIGKRLAEQGISVIDSDKTARDAVKKGSRCLKALVREFSDIILLEDGSLNRKKLGEICFADEKLKNRLNEITHPYIIDLLTTEFENLHRLGEHFCVVEIPALIESGLYAVCDKIVLVTAPFETKVERITVRDGLSREQAVQRLISQVPDREIAPLCDLVIENDGTLCSLDKKIDALSDTIKVWFRD